MCSISANLVVLEVCVAVVEFVYKAAVAISYAVEVSICDKNALFESLVIVLLNTQTSMVHRVLNVSTAVVCNSRRSFRLHMVTPNTAMEVRMVKAVCAEEHTAWARV